MNDESRNFRVEEVDGAAPPPRARVGDADTVPESASDKLERKRDYLEGFISEKPADLPSNEPGGAVYDGVIGALKEVFDPEIPVNIYDLGLVYDVHVSQAGSVAVTMTLTTPHCPVAETLPREVENRINAVSGVSDAVVYIVWDPPWSMDRMSEDAKLELGRL